MCKFYMLVGIAGCGKTKWAIEHLNQKGMFEKIFSSDVYRENLLNDVNDQSNNDLVFQSMHKDIINALKSNISVCYDATNLTIKNRKNILDLISQNNIDCEKIAVLFEVEESIIREQNNKRDRKVPDTILNKMFRKFEIPFLGEGFDKIDVVFRDSIDKIQYTEMPLLMDGFNQDNPHHTLTLLEHCKNCYSNLIKNEDINDNIELLTASLIHDLGKLYTKEYDEKKGYCHFIGHENYGAYKSLFLNYAPLVVNKEKVAFYINYHMKPYNLKNAKNETKDKYMALFGEEWYNILTLHEADSSAH